MSNQGFEIEFPVEFNTISLRKQEKKKQELVKIEDLIDKVQKQVSNLEDFFEGPCYSSRVTMGEWRQKEAELDILQERVRKLSRQRNALKLS
jgi:hypothetical protein